MIRLYDYFRSSSSYRVRIALHFKNIEFETEHVDLVSGAQREESFTGINPQGFVPALRDGDITLTQSPAILEYLEEQYPHIPLLPTKPEERAYVRQMAMIIACDIHPLNNLKVWKGYVGKVLGANEAQMKDWYAHWIHDGLKSYETLLVASKFPGKMTFGDTPTLADLYLIPQLYNARRFDVDLSAYPRICEIEHHCLKLEAFQKAAPESHVAAPDGLEVIHGPFSPLLANAA